MTIKQDRINAGNNFINMGSKINQLQKEVQSLKDDWLMCDEACDQKEFKIRELQNILTKIRIEYGITDIQRFKDDCWQITSVQPPTTDHYLKEEK